MNTKSAKLSFALVLLAGCASAAPKWQHAQFVGADADRQFLVADGQCIKEASTAISIPPAPPQTQQQQSYTIQGQAQTSVGAAPPTTTRYSAQVQPQFNVAQAMQSVQDAGAAGARQGAALNAQRRIYAGCMASLGWSQVQSQ